MEHSFYRNYRMQMTLLANPSAVTPDASAATGTGSAAFTIGNK